MTQAEITARRRLEAIFEGPYERLGPSSVSDLRKLHRRRKKQFSLDEQIKIEVCYGMVFEITPSVPSLSEMANKKKKTRIFA